MLAGGGPGSKVVRRYSGPGVEAGALGTPADPGSRTNAVGAKGIVLMAAAVLLGIVLLNEFDPGSVPFTEPVEVDTGPTTTRRLPTVSTTPTTVRAARPPADVRVLAANGTNTSGLGGRTTDFLRNAGYNAVAPIDASRVVEATIIAYKPEAEPEARVMQQLLQLPATSVRAYDANATPVPEDRGAEIVVIVGPDLRLP